MKFLCYPVFLAITLPLTASANDIDGKWRAWFVGSDRPKLAAIVFDFKVEGDKLTGMAYMADCPSDAPISDGKIDGNRVSFTVIGKHPWESWVNESGRKTSRSSGYTRLRFTGTIRESQLKLSLIWDSVLIYGTRGGDAHEMEMEGKRMLSSQ